MLRVIMTSVSKSTYELNTQVKNHHSSDICIITFELNFLVSGKI